MFGSGDCVSTDSHNNGLNVKISQFSWAFGKHIFAVLFRERFIFGCEKIGDIENGSGRSG